MAALPSFTAKVGELGAAPRPALSPSCFQLLIRRLNDEVESSADGQLRVLLLLWTCRHHHWRAIGR